MSEDPLWPRASGWLAGGGAPDGPHLQLVGVPCARSSISPSRADLTPAAVRRALRRFATYDADLDADLATVRVSDAGDLPVAEHDAAGVLVVVDEGVRRLPPADVTVLVGGDNALTRPALRGLLPGLRGAGLLTLDAHHDVRGFHAGPTNGTPVRGLVEDGLPGRNVVQVGIGALTNSRAYRRWCDEHGITVVGAAQARRDGVGAVVRQALEQLAARCSAVYVDLDVDVVDAAFAPGCPGARPGGLMPWELLDAAAEAGRHPAVRAVDVVEVDAAADEGGRTVDLAAQCVLRVAAGLAVR
ncbi:MAG TPA: arginase family protein [Mycobacteriales bacterium]|nr:arginase family protein [Mycobacteriales bacterium]